MSTQTYCPVCSTCKVCGCEGERIHTNANKHGDIPFIYSFRCRGCGLVFVGNRPTNDQLGAAYATMDSRRYYADIAQTNLLKLRRCVASLETLLSRDAAIIDLGCGDGEFPLLLKRRGFASVFGHEIPGNDVSKLAANSIRVWQDYDYETLPEETFDAVTMLDVAEHVLSPVRLFAACHRILKPGGLLYVHTPGVSRLDRAMHYLGPVGKRWQKGRTSIFHLQNYSRRSLELLLADFHEVTIRQVNELTWPVSKYVATYLNPPRALIPLLSAAAWPLIATSMNSNKMVVTAHKP